ncbi:uncharacterized protein LOC110019298 [Phalaenopsis equestris]|uniref:uncharacterized protein LOC110019298 n=1 Tax=Phalaenopsis equestris TaxID=78828 RepID=UPI0009E559E7|nr:uncharacterized protein LOC110019298 [Phalaenopsis equestris]
MTLLQTITCAKEAADAGDLSSSPTIPITLNANDILPTLKPDVESLTSLPVVRLSGWSISTSDSKIIESTTKFSKSLNKKLKKPQSLDRAEFLKLLNGFLQAIGENLGLRLNPEVSSLHSFDFARTAIGKVGDFIGREVAGLIVDVCVVLELWELVESLIVRGLVGHLYTTNLVEKLVEQNQARLLCLCAKHITDLRPSELLLLLRFCLSPSDKAYRSFLEVRKEWERQALLAIEKATNKSMSKKAVILAREASVLLMVAHDGFSAAELCLHYVFGRSDIDNLVFSSAISMLGGREILSLIRYLGKWLKKYESFPEAVPCPQAKSMLSLSACEDIPSFDSVLRALGLILDGNFSYLVLNSEFHDEMSDLQKVVSDLVSEADASSPVNVIVKHLKSQYRKNGNHQAEFV